MQPILFSFGKIHVYSWGFMLALAIILGTYLLSKKASTEGVDSNVLIDLVIWMVVGGVIGARLFYVLIYEPSYYLHNPLKVIALWEGGLVFYGGLIGGAVTAGYFIKKNMLNFWQVGDLIAPFLSLGYAIVRIGCFLNGCCYGKETDLPWGVVFPQLIGIRHPTQIYSSLFGLIIFCILIFLFRYKKFHGQIILLYGILYGISRFIVEGFRENLVVIGGLTVAQLISIVLIIVSSILYFLKIKNLIK